MGEHGGRIKVDRGQSEGARILVILPSAMTLRKKMNRIQFDGSRRAPWCIVIKIPILEGMLRENGYVGSFVMQSQAVAPAEVSRREIRKVDSRNRMSGGRILVVEDDDCLRRVTQAQLEKCGYQTAIASDVPEALAVLEKQPVDLVVTDLNCQACQAWSC